MSFNTVGELIKVLQEFDPATPTLKLDLSTDTYLNLDLTGRMLFKVRPIMKWVDTKLETDYDTYVDAEAGFPGAFDAIVL